MKKFLKGLTLCSLMVCLSGCFRSDGLTNNDIYTTIYPIQYLTDYLYGEDKNIMSIYPNGADVSVYKLTEKQKEAYSKGAVFVYNGATDEKEIARDFRNNNDNMLLIDASYELKNYNEVEELWLCPNNYLMLAKNIRKVLVENITSKVVKEKIEANLQELDEVLSSMDADLRAIAKNAKENGSNTLVVSSSKLAFLEKYGFDLIILDGNINEATIIANFKDNKYKDIYVANNEEPSELVKKLETEYKANIMEVDLLYTLSDEQSANNEDYQTIMQNLIDNIRNTTLS